MDVDVLVVGDANLDLILTTDAPPRFGQAEQLVDGAELVLGSSAGIVAHGLARLEVSTAIVARVGDDGFGAEFQRILDEAHVRTDALIVVPDVRTGLSIHLSTPDDRSILTYTGAMATLTAEDVRQAIDSLQPRHVHFAAVYLLPALAPHLPQLMHELRDRGLTISVDTNADPEERWAGPALWLDAIDLLLPNETELRGIARALGVVGEDAEALARGLSERGAGVVVKLGAEGAFGAVGDVTARAAAEPVTPLETVGAGDSFDAAFLAAWLAGQGIGTALRWGCAAGASSVQAIGGVSGQPTRAELLALG